METWGVVFLGIIAVASIVQAAFLLGLALAGRRLSRRLHEIERRLDREIGPTLANVERVTRAVAEIADLATLQARRLDLVLADAILKVEETTATVQKLVLRPLRPLGSVLAFLKGVQRGLEVYFRLAHSSPAEPRRRGHGEDDEHLFI